MLAMTHLILVNTKTTASQLSWIYIREIVRLHGLAESIVSNRDSKFTSKWWKELHRLMGTKLLMSTAFHPQMDGVTEQVNRSICQIFHALIQPDQRNWVEKAPLVEFAINSTISSTTGFALFELTSGMVPQMMHEVVKEEHTPPSVRSFAVKPLCNMAVAHNMIIAVRVFQTHHTNKKCIEEKPLSAGELVYLSTKNLSLPKGRASKLLPKFVGLYKITKAIPSSSNYELELLEELARQ
jgi:hypothetical protein